MTTDSVDLDAKLTFNEAAQTITFPLITDSLTLSGGAASASSSYTVTLTYTISSAYAMPAVTKT